MAWKVTDLGREVPSQSEIYNLAKTITNPVHRTLFILSYLTAGRVQEVLSLKRNQIEFEIIRNRQVMSIYHMPNEKNKKKNLKSFFIPLDREGKLVGLIRDYLYSLQSEQRIFTSFKTRQRAWQILKKLDFHPHYLRHIRLTHLVTIYNLTDRLLVEFAGWTDSQPAKFYMELRPGDILEKM